MQTFGNLIRIAREKKGLYLRQVSASVDIDQAIISKFERGERKPSKEQVEKFAIFYNIDKNILMTAWLSDNIANSIIEEENAVEVLMIAKQKIEYLKSTKYGKI